MYLCTYTIFECGVSSVSDSFELKKIATIENAFTENFGIPRQSGIAESLLSRIIFEPEFRREEAVRELADFSHIWLIWKFTEAERDNWSPTVRPPRLGGNKRVGVFATRSPFRPNPIGLSCVKLVSIEYDKNKGPVLTVAGADLLNGTPIYDIKPYIPYADLKTDAKEGFTALEKRRCEVVCSKALLEVLPFSLQNALLEVLAEDPRPAYQSNPDRVYKMSFGGFRVSFKVEDTTLNVINIERE